MCNIDCVPVPALQPYTKVTSIAHMSVQHLSNVFANHVTSSVPRVLSHTTRVVPCHTCCGALACNAQV